MRAHRILFMTVIVMIFSVSLFAKERIKVTIPKGKGQVYRAGYNIERVNSVNRSICLPGMRSESEVWLQGFAPGTTDVFITGTDGSETIVEVTVIDLSPGKTAKRLESVFKNIEGVTVRIDAGAVIVEGEVFSEKDLSLVNRVMKNEPTAVNMVSLSETYRKVLAEEIQTALEEDGIKGVRVKMSRDGFILSGNVTRRKFADRAMRIADSYSKRLANAIQVIPDPRLEKSVIVRVSIMEIKKNAMRGLGIHWNPGSTKDIEAEGEISGAHGQKPTITGAVSGFLSNLLPKQKIIRDRDFGRSLFEQDILTMSGAEAVFFGGTEIPIPVAQEGGTMSIIYKKVGLSLKTTPVIEVDGSVTIPVQIQSSRVVARDTSGNPILTTHDIQTRLNVKENQSVAFAGIIGQNETSLISNSHPDKVSSFLQFNSENGKERKQTEIVVFLTPKTIRQGENGAEEMMQTVKNDFIDAEYRQLETQQEKENEDRLKQEKIRSGR